MSVNSLRSAHRLKVRKLKNRAPPKIGAANAIINFNLNYVLPPALLCLAARPPSLPRGGLVTRELKGGREGEI